MKRQIPRGSSLSPAPESKAAENSSTLNAAMMMQKTCEVEENYN